MKCAQVVRMFGAYWDDEITQAEREWVDAHLASCASCRKEYEAFARTLEVMGSLPRIEPAPDLVERVLARARRASPAPDRVPAASRPWVPVTAAAVAVAVLAGSLAMPWLGMRTESRRPAATGPVAHLEPARALPPVEGPAPALPDDPGASAERGAGPVAHVAADSLFDHSEDIEFILDPVRLQRGRATVSRPPATQGEKAVLSF